MTSPRGKASVPSRSTLAVSLPDPIIVRVLESVACPYLSAPDVDAGWPNDTPGDPFAVQKSLGGVRLASRRLLQLSNPIYFHRFTLTDPLSLKQSTRLLRQKRRISYELDPDAELDAILRLFRAKAPGVSHTNGELVKVLVLADGAFRGVVEGLLSRLSELFPNLSSLSRLWTGALPAHLSSTLYARLPKSITTLAGGAAYRFDAPLALDISDSEPADDDQDRIGGARAEGSSRGGEPQSHQEAWFELVERLPGLREVSAAGLWIDDEWAARWIWAMESKKVWYGTLGMAQITARNGLDRGSGWNGLRVLSLTACTIDLMLLEALPRVAPDLEELHIRVKCQLQDATELRSRWSLADDLIARLPKLTALAFVGQPPADEESLAWANCDTVLTHAPKLGFLHVRRDLITSRFFLELSSHIASPDLSRLSTLRIWQTDCNGSPFGSWLRASGTALSRRINTSACFDTPLEIEVLALITAKWFSRELGGIKWPAAEDAKGQIGLLEKAGWMVEERRKGIEDGRLALLAGSGGKELAAIAANEEPDELEDLGLMEEQGSDEQMDEDDDWQSACGDWDWANDI